MLVPAPTFVPLIVIGDQCPSGARGRPACRLHLRVRPRPVAMAARAELGTIGDPAVLDCYMPNTTKPTPHPLFTPSTLPEPVAPDPVVTFIEDALLAIANRQDAKIPEPSA